MKGGKSMGLAKWVIVMVLVFTPVVGMAQELPKKPWGQVFQEDVRNLEGAYHTPTGFYIDGVRVNPGDYSVYKALTELSREVQRLREEVMELKDSLERSGD
jgi:hypothetical protein